MKWFWAALAAVSIAGASSLGLPNEVFNGTFDEGFIGWDVTGGVELWNEGVPDTSAWCVSNWGVDEGTIEQCWAVDPGYYIVDVSYYWKIWDNSPAYPSIVRVELTVDGEVVASVEHTEPLDQWIYEEFYWEGWVECYKDIHIYLKGDGQGSDGWGLAAIDVIDVEEYIVPEPASIALLATGLAGLVGLTRRR